MLQRPDVFHAAIAGAPVTEWRLYDTHYTERYLGDPTVDAAPYARNSLLPLAHQLTRPLLLIHGLADDNVVAAHTLQLSSALLAAGKPHELLALVGCHAHDAAGGRRREPAAPPARVPASAACAGVELTKLSCPVGTPSTGTTRRTMNQRLRTLYANVAGARHGATASTRPRSSCCCW